MISPVLVVATALATALHGLTVYPENLRSAVECSGAFQTPPLTADFPPSRCLSTGVTAVLVCPPFALIRHFRLAFTSL